MMIPIRKVKYSGKMTKLWLKIGKTYETPGILPIEIASRWLENEKANGFIGYLEHLSENEHEKIRKSF